MNSSSGNHILLNLFHGLFEELVENCAVRVVLIWDDAKAACDMDAPCDMDTPCDMDAPCDMDTPCDVNVDAAESR